jgi:hypothetical protein
MEVKYMERAELLRLKEIEYKQISGVFYHLWINRATPSEILEIIDWIELLFDDGSHIYFTGGEESDAIRVREEAPVRNPERLKEFGGKILFETREVTGSDVWLDAIGKPIIGIELPSDDRKKYLSNAMLFDFGDHKVEIRLIEEGLHAEAFTDEDEDEQAGN